MYSEIDEYGLCEYEEEFGIELAGYVPARALAFWDGYSKPRHLTRAL